MAAGAGAAAASAPGAGAAPASAAGTAGGVWAGSGLRARAQSAILHAESQVYRLLDEVPYEQLSGVRIGADFAAEGSAKTRSARSGVSQKVSRNVTTNCPSCNAPITVGASPCPNCGTVLDWG